MALQSRPPIVTILGHVDHGKTTLLDYIRHSRVQAGEAGGITQHIGAYQIEHKGKKITFIDTPGHAAFNKMRQRGAQITDLVVLVVAANDGVKPQTIESIRYIKESKVPFVVAINKTDIPDVNLDNVKSQLAEQEVIITEYKGDVETVELSAKTGKNVDKLLETLSVMAELLELKADPTRPLEAVVIESSKDSHRGPLASVIVKQGTLRLRQDIIIEEIEGRVKLLSDENGKPLQEVLPGCPAELTGLKDVPEVGEIVREIGVEYQEVVPEDAPVAQVESADPFSDLDFGSAFSDIQKLKLIVKADVKGTLEAIKQNIDSESVELLQAEVGNVNDSDIELAETSNALIIAFQLKVPRKIKDLAKKSRVKLKEYDIIYHLIEDLQKQMLKIMEPTIDEVVTGQAEILQIFEMRGEKIAGVRVKTGELKKNDLFHLRRDGEILLNPVVKSMKRGKEDIDVIKTKGEAGLTFKNKKLDFQVGDVVEAYKVEE